MHVIRDSESYKKMKIEKEPDIEKVNFEVINMNELNKEIDWGLFVSPYFKPEETPKDIVLTKWRQIERDFSGKSVPGIKFQVVQENGEPTEKEWTVVSRTAIMQLRPFVKVAEVEGKDKFKIRVSKTGEGANTKYHIRGTEA